LLPLAMYFACYTIPILAPGILCAYKIIQRISCMFGCEPPFTFTGEVQANLYITNFFINLPFPLAVYG
jgi:hypothetical protein